MRKRKSCTPVSLASKLAKFSYALAVSALMITPNICRADGSEGVVTVVPGQGILTDGKFQTLYKNSEGSVSILFYHAGKPKKDGTMEWRWLFKNSFNAKVEGKISITMVGGDNSHIAPEFKLVPNQQDKKLYYTGNIAYPKQVTTVELLELKVDGAYLLKRGDSSGKQPPSGKTKLPPGVTVEEYPGVNKKAREGKMLEVAEGTQYSHSSWSAWIAPEKTAGHIRARIRRTAKMSDGKYQWEWEIMDVGPDADYQIEYFVTDKPGKFVPDQKGELNKKSAVMRGKGVFAAAKKLYMGMVVVPVKK